MQARIATTPTTPTSQATRGSLQDEGLAEFPVREYIGAMAMELAQMARWDGDETLGKLLDSAASLAAEPSVRSANERPQTTTPRSA